MGAEREPEIEGWLREEAARPIPDPRPDLIARTLGRIRGWLLVRDLVGFATLECIWGARRPPARDAGAEGGGARQDIHKG